MSDAAHHQPRRAGSSDARWRLAALLLTSTVFSIGCNPLTSLFFLLAPDPKFPADCVLNDKKKDPKVALLVSHAKLQVNTDLQFADRELETALTKTLAERYKDNGDKVEIIPAYKVREYKSNNGDWKNQGPFEIGKRLGVDYVINVEINKISLFEEGSSNTLYRGRAEVYVSCTDVNGPEEQGPIYTKDYVALYPSHAPEPTDYSVGIFRNRFVHRMARDLSRSFASYPSKDKIDMD